mmetsp:Transcript_3993/g.16661  ORF Transcript_3993/g.16661 Transcript_3993/m.16661 type:complete len:226 (-) Transcript_3993:3026-3703(-)
MTLAISAQALSVEAWNSVSIAPGYESKSAAVGPHSRATTEPSSPVKVPLQAALVSTEGSVQEDSVPLNSDTPRMAKIVHSRSVRAVTLAMEGKAASRARSTMRISGERTTTRTGRTARSTRSAPTLGRARAAIEKTTATASMRFHAFRRYPCGRPRRLFGAGPVHRPSATTFIAASRANSTANTTFSHCSATASWLDGSSSGLSSARQTHERRIRHSTTASTHGE